VWSFWVSRSNISYRFVNAFQNLYGIERIDTIFTNFHICTETRNTWFQCTCQKLFVSRPSMPRLLCFCLQWACVHSINHYPHRQRRPEADESHSILTHLSRFCTSLFAYSKAKFNNSGNKASAYFRLLWTANVSDKCLLIRSVTIGYIQTHFY
jgi:hypothetical protein